MNELGSRFRIHNPQATPETETLRQAINRTREKIEHGLLFTDPKPPLTWRQQASKWQWRFKDAFKALKGEFDNGYE